MPGALASRRVRQARAEIRQALANGQLCAAQLLRDPPDAIADMRTAEFLEAVPAIGRKKIERLNVRAARADVNLMRPLGRLTERQREWLIAAALPPYRKTT